MYRYYIFIYVMYSISQKNIFSHPPPKSFLNWRHWLRVRVLRNVHSPCNYHHSRCEGSFLRAHINNKFTRHRQSTCWTYGGVCISLNWWFGNLKSLLYSGKMDCYAGCLRWEIIGKCRNCSTLPFVSWFKPAYTRCCTCKVMDSNDEKECSIKLN